MKHLTIILTVILTVMSISCEKESNSETMKDTDTTSFVPLIETGVYTGENGELTINLTGECYTMVYDGSTFNINGIIDDFGCIIFAVMQGNYLIYSGVYKDGKISLLTDIGEFVGSFKID